MKKQISLISIIIPSYNRAHLIGETLDSVLNQTYQNWECIVVDDGSTDNTLAISKKFAEKDTRFKIYQRNRGPKGAPTCRNIGVEKSQGEYLIFLDSDDLLADYCLERRLFFFNKHQDKDFLVFSTLEFKKTITDTNIILNVQTTQDLIERFLNMDVPWLTTAPIWKRKTFLEVGLWKENLIALQDWELHIRALLRGFCFIYFSEIDNYLRRDNHLDTIGNNALATKEQFINYLSLFLHLKTEMKNSSNYIQRLNGLIFWLGEKALQHKYKDIVKHTIFNTEINLSKKKRYFNLLSYILFERIYFRHPMVPDFGTMGKVIYLPNQKV